MIDATVLTQGVKLGISFAGLTTALGVLVPLYRMFDGKQKERDAKSEERGEQKAQFAAMVNSLEEIKEAASMKGERGQQLESIVTQLGGIVSNVGDIGRRVDKIDMALVGKDGLNGMRSSLNEMKDSLAEIRTGQHARLGEWGLWREKKEEHDETLSRSVAAIERRLADLPRRKSTRAVGNKGRRSKDKDT